MAKKTVKKATTKKKRKTPAQYQAEIDELGERLNIQKYLYTTLVTAVESERALTKTIVSSYEELRRQHIDLASRYNNLFTVYREAVDQLGDDIHQMSHLEGKVEGMMHAYQHALETVTDNMGTNMVTMLTESSAQPPTS